MSASKTKIFIRQMEFDDLQKVYYLGAKLFTAEKWPVLYRTWDEYEILERYISDPEFCLVAEYEDEIVGFALGTLIEKPKASWVYGYLLWLAVDDAKQNLGVGKKLHAKMTKLFIEEGARIMMIDTARDNKRAIAFFQKRGFDSVEEHVYMTKNLGDHPRYKAKRKKRLLKRIRVLPKRKS